MKTKKIIIFTGYFLPHLGGVERYVDKLSTALANLGYEIVIVTSNHDDRESYEKSAGRTIYRLPIRSFAKNRYPIPNKNAEYKHLTSQIEAEQGDYFIVNTRFHLTSYVGASLGKKLGRPVMLIEHGTNHFTINNRILDFFGLIYEHVLTYFLAKKVDKYYGVSQKCNEWLKHFSIQADGVFYNAINPEDAAQIKDYFKDAFEQDEIVISFAGRLIKEKGILNLLDAFLAFKKENASPKVRLAVAGDGDLLEMIKNTYTDPSVSILGRLDFEHVMALYKRSDVFAHPSLYPEGLPTSLLEAGLMNCAVIATPKGGTEEVIVDDHHGIIVDGSKESLLEAIALLATNPTMRNELAKNIRERIETNFNWVAVAKTVDKEIKSFDTE